MPASTLHLPPAMRPAKATGWLLLKSEGVLARAFPDGSVLLRACYADGRSDPPAAAYEAQECGEDQDAAFIEALRAAMGGHRSKSSGGA